MVIAIIAILAAILFPVFARAKELSKERACATHMSQTGKAYLMYQDDSDGRVPPAYYWSTAVKSIPDNQGFWAWPWLTRPYAESFQVYTCPSDTKDDPSCHADECGVPGPYSCRDQRNPCFGYLFGRFPSWGYNFWYLSPGRDTDYPDNEPFFPVTARKIQDPADTVVYAESTSLFPDGPGYRITSDIGYILVYPPQKWTLTLPADGTTFGHVWPRHNREHVTTLFQDGHVKSISLGRLKDESLWDLR